VKSFFSPIGFDQIIDQEKPISYLKSFIRKDSCAGAYLFIGQEGIGKKSTAICFAKALTCHKPSPEPCNVCSSCKKIPHPFFFHPDVTIYHDIYSPLVIPRIILLKKMGFKENELEKSENIYLECCKLLEKKGFLLSPVNPHNWIYTIDFFYLNPDIIFVEKEGTCYISATQIEENLELLNKQDPHAYFLAKLLYTSTSGFYKQSFKIGKQDNSDGKENIRALCKEIYLKPLEGKRKVFIIDDAHKMTEEAADAFLKTLEEPPLDSIIILVTSKPEMLLPTIHSRCQKIKFHPVSKKSIHEFIKNTKNLADKDSMLIASLAQGSISKALEINLEETLKKRDKVINFIRSDNMMDIEKFFYFVREFSDESEKDRRRRAKSTQQFIELMSAWFHDLILIKRDGNRNSIINFDKLTELRETSQKFKSEQLEDIFSILSETNQLLLMNFDVRLTIEALLVEISRNIKS